VTESHEQDPSQVPELLPQVDRVSDHFIGDGIYDQEPVYAAVMDHAPGASMIIPPRKDAVLSRQVATSPNWPARCSIDYGNWAGRNRIQ
jgi:hypothetical protein